MSWEYKIIKHIKSGKVLSLAEAVLQVPFRLAIKFGGPRQERGGEKRYKFSVCGMFRNEGPFLKEWVDYYRVIGTDHIYLYNNKSTDGFREVLRPYVEEGYVTLVEWEKDYAQMAAYEDCYRRFGGETEWIGFFDLDEFLCPRKERTVGEFLEKYRGYPGVLVFWRLFGTNGQLEAQPGKLVTEQYLCSWEELDCVGKVIISTSHRFLPTRFYCHHMYFGYRWLGFLPLKVPVVDEHKRFLFFQGFLRAPRRNTIQLNHYFSKSYADFVRKVNKPSSANQGDEKMRRSMDFFLMHEMGNTGADMAIFRFMTLLKKRYYNIK